MSTEEFVLYEIREKALRLSYARAKQYLGSFFPEDRLYKLRHEEFSPAEIKLMEFMENYDLWKDNVIDPYRMNRGSNLERTYYAVAKRLGLYPMPRFWKVKRRILDEER